VIEVAPGDYFNDRAGVFGDEKRVQMLPSRQLKPYSVSDAA